MCSSDHDMFLWDSREVSSFPRIYRREGPLADRSARRRPIAVGYLTVLFLSVTGGQKIGCSDLDECLATVVKSFTPLDVPLASLSGRSVSVTTCSLRGEPHSVVPFSYKRSKNMCHSDHDACCARFVKLSSYVFAMCRRVAEASQQWAMTEHLCERNCCPSVMS